jgi:hypothetical protein
MVPVTTSVPRSRGVRSAGQLDRAAGVLLGAAMPGAPGMQLAVCVAQVAASGADLRDKEALDAIALSLLHWTDGGVAGDSVLLRTAVVALPYLDDPEAMAQAARAVSDLTHPDPLAGDACVLWCAAIRRAVLDGTFSGPREGLPLLPAGHRDRWAGWIAEAEACEPGRFLGNSATPDGSVVPSLQAAWSAVSQAYVLIEGAFDGAAGRDHIDLSLAAIRSRAAADTVAAIAGALLGARWGAGVLLSSGLATRGQGLVRIALSSV